MGTSLPNDYACNWRATFNTGFSGPLVDTKIILEITSPVNPIDAGTVTGNPFTQDSSYTR